MYISMWGAIGWLGFVAAVFTLIGGGIGYYTALKDEQAKQQKALDNSAITPYFDSSLRIIHSPHIHPDKMYKHNNFIIVGDNVYRKIKGVKQ